MSDKTHDQALSGVTEVATVEAAQPGSLKIRFLPKAVVFVGAVLTLSWFFEGWREVNTNPGITSFAVLIGGTLGTAFLLTLSAYWIYIEEKSRGALQRRIKLFEKIHSFLNEKNGVKKEREIS